MSTLPTTTLPTTRTSALLRRLIVAAAALALEAQVETHGAERGLLDRLQQLRARCAVAARVKLGRLAQRVDGRGVHLHARALRARRCVFAAAIDGVHAPGADVARAFADASRRCGDGVEHDVDMLAFGAGRDVVHRDRDALGARGQTAPLERGRKTVAVAGAARFEHAVGIKRRALEVHARRVGSLGDARRIGLIAARRVVIRWRRRRAIVALLSAAASLSTSTLSTSTLSSTLPTTLPTPLAARTAGAALVAARVGFLGHLAVGVGELKVHLAFGLDAVRDGAFLASEFILERPRLFARLLEAGDACATQRLQRGTQRVRMRLRGDLALVAFAIERDFALHAAVDVGIGLRRVVVVRARAAAEPLALR